MVFLWVGLMVAQKAEWTEQLMVALRADLMALPSGLGSVEHSEPQTAGWTVEATVACSVASLVEPKVLRRVDSKDVHLAATRARNLAERLVDHSAAKMVARKAARMADHWDETRAVPMVVTMAA